MYSFIKFFIRVDISIKAITFLFRGSVSVLCEVQEECCVLKTYLYFCLCLTYRQRLNSLLDLMKFVMSYLQNLPRIVTNILHVKT